MRGLWLRAAHWFLGVSVFVGSWFALAVWLSAGATNSVSSANHPGWHHLSTAFGDLETPSGSTQQVLSLIFDVNNDGLNDFVIGSRRTPGPSLVWYRRHATGWTRHVIETDTWQMEAGGAFYDIDGDGDLDLVAGTNNQDNDIWWWENPYPNFDGGDWTRREIKTAGANKHHDMMFGNFDNDATTEFVFWNQAAKQLSIVEIPGNPRTTEPWPDVSTVWTAPSNQYEGLAQADIDGDGLTDIIGGGYWFKFDNGAFTPHLIELSPFGRVAVAQLIPGGRPEIVQVPGDNDGPARWFEWQGNGWVGRTLPVGTVRHGHSVEIGDVDQDGHLDIFVAEIRQKGGSAPDNPDARAIILFGDGAGNFTAEVLTTGFGHHESRLADLDGDGDLDILGKPFLWDTPRLDIWLNNLHGDPPPCEPLAGWSTHMVDNARPRRAVFMDAADIDGDGLTDIVAGAWWYRNPGQPGGQWARTEIGAPLNQMAIIADFDGDGDADILGTIAEGAQEHTGNDFVWARNNGTGQFTILNNVPAGSGNFLQGAAFGSFAGGGQQVALSWHNEAGGTESLRVPADPVGTPWTLETFSSFSAGEALSAGDIDGDGDHDLLLGTSWLENAAAGWEEHTLFATTLEADRNQLADMDGDGDLDAVIGYEGISVSRPVAWYEQPNDPTNPWPQHLIGNATGPQSLDVGDLDGDGDMDVVVGEHNLSNPTAGRVLVFENDSGDWQQHLVAAGHEHHDGTQLADIDNDGDLDIVSIGWSHAAVLLYENTGCSPSPTGTSTPTHVPDATATDTPESTATSTIPASTPTDTPESTATSTIPASTPTATPSSTPSAVPDAGAGYLISLTSNGSVGGVSFADEDVLRFDIATGQWSLYLDGSDIGLASRDIDSIYPLPDGSFLLSLDAPLNVAGLAVDDSDILRFVPTSLGENTAGSLSLYFDGSDVGLTTNAEDVNVIIMTDEGLLLSVTSTAKVPGVDKASDEDLLLFQPTSLGADTAGTWSLYFDGSNMGLGQSGERIFAASRHHSGGPLYLVGSNKTSIGAMSAGVSDVFTCAMTGTGPATACSPAPGVVWRGGNHGLGKRAIDALAVVGDDDSPPLPTPSATPPTATATPSTTPEPCGPGSAIGQWQWQRHVIDAARPGRAAFLFTFDINGDGQDDVLTGKYWYTNPGSPGGAWSRTQLPAPIEDTIAAYDFDGDGDLDLLASTGATEPMDQSRWWPFVWARNEGGGSFTVFDKLDVSGITMPKNDPIQGVAIARHTAGGPLQVIVTWDDTEHPNRNPHGVQMFTVPADPATQTWPRQKISDVSTGEQLTAVDLDGDADLDVFMGNIWLRNNHPTNSWTPITIFSVSSGQTSRHEVVDVDGDGDLDAFIGYSHDPEGRKLSWHEQGSSPQATWGHNLINNLTRGYAESLDAGDLDGDGDPDVIVGEYNMQSAVERPASLWIFENRGQGDNWTKHLVYDGDSHYQSSQAFDIDGDGDLDILSKGWHHTRVHLYENRGCAP